MSVFFSTFCSLYPQFSIEAKYISDYQAIMKKKLMYVSVDNFRHLEIKHAQTRYYMSLKKRNLNSLCMAIPCAVSLTWFYRH